MEKVANEILRRLKQLEESDLRSVGEWAFAELCGQARRWRYVRLSPLVIG